MRKIVLLGLVSLAAAACHSSSSEEPRTAPTPANSVAAAGATPRSALDAFMSAVRSQDLQAMSLAWGDKNGPVRDSKSMARQEMEQREVVLMKCFRHDSYKVLSENSALDGERQMQVELTKGTGKRVTDFFLSKGPTRWYVRSASIEPVKELCSAKTQ